MMYGVAAIQFEPVFRRPDLNVPAALALVEEAAGQGAQLIVLPEMANIGYCFANREEARPYMQTVPGPLTQQLEHTAHRLGCILVCGMGEVDEQTGLFYNTAAVVGPKGYLGKYRKTHFFSADAKWAVEGDMGFPVWDTDLGRLGVAICMDATYPEVGRLLALHGAEVVCFPTNWVGSVTPDHRWISQAYENGMYWVAANRWGEERGLHFTGGSCIVEPDGRIQARAPRTGNCIVYGTIDRSLAGARTFVSDGQEHKLRDRRPAVYREMLQAPYTWSPTFYHALYGATGLPAPRESSVGVVQCGSSEEDIEQIRNTVRADTANSHIDLLVLPALLGIEATQGTPSVQPGLVGLDALQSIARESSCLVAGSILEVEDRVRYHTAVLVGPDGLIGTQRACHLMQSDTEWATPGAGPLSPFDTPIGRIGLLTGYDACFFESFRVLATAGADIVCVPAHIPWTTGGTVPDSDRTWNYWRSKAWESCVVVALANYSTPAASGGSGVWVPHVREDTSMETVAGADDTGVFTATVNTHSRYIREKRALGWRHLQSYKPLVAPFDFESFDASPMRKLPLETEAKSHDLGY